MYTSVDTGTYGYQSNYSVISRGRRRGDVSRRMDGITLEKILREIGYILLLDTSSFTHVASFLSFSSPFFFSFF